MSEENHDVPNEIMDTYYAQSTLPTDEELRALGIDLSRVYRIDNGPGVTLAAYLAQVKQAVDDILKREGDPHA